MCLVKKKLYKQSIFCRRIKSSAHRSLCYIANPFLSIDCIIYHTVEEGKKITCICRRNEGRGGTLITLHWKTLWMKGLFGPKVLRIATTIASLTMSTAEKPISYCSHWGYLAFTSCLPMERSFVIKTAWGQGNDVTPSAQALNHNCVHFKVHLYSHKSSNKAEAVYEGKHEQYNDHIIKDNHGVSYSFYMSWTAGGQDSLTGWVDVCYCQGVYVRERKRERD